MLAPPSSQKSWSLLDAISNWWSNWTKKICGIGAELLRGGRNQPHRKDLGMSTDEFHKLVSCGPEAANLLLRRMAALDLDRSEVSRTEPRCSRNFRKLAPFVKVAAGVSEI